MHVLIVYASNSGSTFQVAEMLGTILGTEHTVVVQKAEITTPDDLMKHDLVLLGSPSWSVEKKEGMPLPAMLALLRNAEPFNFSKHTFALFGCGDALYTNFCGAVDYMEEWLTRVHGRKLLNSLRIEGYYFDLKKNVSLVGGWGREVAKMMK